MRSKSRIGVQRVAGSSGALRSMSTLGEELLETPLGGSPYANTCSVSFTKLVPMKIQKV